MSHSDFKAYVTGRDIRSDTPEIPRPYIEREASPALGRAAAFLASELRQSITSEREIVLFGDFDVDGTSSAAILFLFARLCGVQDLTPYISRRGDGYGLTGKSLRRLMTEANSPRTTTVILMDLGVNTLSQAETLLRAGYRLMVIDHHVPSPDAATKWQELSDRYGADMVHAYDPLLFSDPADRRLRCLSAAGLVYNLCLEILQENLEGFQDQLFSSEIEPRVSVRPSSPPQPMETILNSMSKIAAIAQAADCMPFAVESESGPGEELSKAWHFSKEFELSGALLGGVKVLCELTGTASRIGWVIGPVLNAAGRLEDAYAAFELLIEVDEKRARSRLDEMQQVRQRVRGQTERAADSLTEDLISPPGEGLAILRRSSDQVSAGVVGIGAARAADRFKAPALYLSESTDAEGRKILKGSMRRGPTDFSCEEWILSLKTEGICFAGGGHPAAAGLALEADQLDRLLASAREQRFSETSPTLWAGSVFDVLAYQKQVARALPFGNSHESAHFLIYGVLHEVQGLTWQNRQSGEREVWAYALTVSDPTTKTRTQIKLMESYLSDSQREMFQELDGIAIDSPFQAEVVIHDGLKQNSRYERTDIRVAEIAVGEEKMAGIHFISDESLQAAVAGTHVLDTHQLDIQKATEEADNRIVLHIDWQPENHRRTFLLKKPPPWELEKRLSEEEIQGLKSFHGGRYDRSAKCHQITWGVMDILIKQKNTHPLWRVEFSPAALTHYEELRREDTEVASSKAMTDPFTIPHLREGITPYGFQYADIRLYLQRLFALSNNDMGTGKTLEGACWGALRHVGASVNEDLSISIPENHEKKPVLYLTLKGVMGQYADELARFTDLPVGTITTTEVSTLLKSHGVAGESDVGGTSFKKVKSVSEGVLSAARDTLLKDRVLIVSTYDTIARNPWMIEQFEWGGVCLDECHELKTPGAHKTKAVFGDQIDGSPLNGAPVLAMSGTFTKNRPSDWFVWVRLTGADGGCYTSGALSRAQVSFDMRFDALTFERARGRGGREYTRSKRGDNPENGEELRTLMAPFLIRRLKTEIADIPPVRTRVHRVASSGLYMDLLGALVANRELPEASRQVLTRHNILHENSLVDEEHEEEGAITLGGQVRRRDYGNLAAKLSMISSLDKALGIEDLLQDLGWLDSDEPIVIMGLHRASVREINARLTARGESVIMMVQEDSAQKRREKQEAFKQGKARIFLTSFGVGGTGLNLTRAAKILAVNLPFIDSYLAQGRDRCHRLGQTREVEFVIAILAGSIDESTWRLIQNKGRANFATMTIDRVKKGQLPSWATSATADQVEIKQGLAPQEESEAKGFVRTGRRRQ